MKFSLLGLSLLFAVGIDALPQDYSHHVLPQSEFEKLSKRQVTQKTCKAVPGSSGWPSESAWQALNTAVNGKLIKTVPPGAACHNTFDGRNTYNQQQCSAATSGWSNQDWHFRDPVSILWPLWTNNTCSPGNNVRNTPCTIGKYPVYVVAADTVQHVQAAVNFARNNNIRLVVRNTGHCFMGKSTGAGSMSVWMRNFKSIEHIEAYNREGEPWKGTAVKIGAGWQLGDLYRELFQRRRVTVGGECAGVGIAGGFIQGGGHGPLSPLYGMGSDQALEFEVVTADGQVKIANRTTNTDLFWALRGGGGATWGVVTSVTVKTYPELRTTGITLSVQGNIQDDLFWNAMEAFHVESLKWIDRDLYIYYEMGSFGGFKMMNVAPILAPGKSASETNAIVQPLLDRWRQMGLQFTSQTREFGSFYEAYTALFSGEGAGQNMLTSGRIITKQNIQQNSRAIMQTFREMANTGRFIIGHILAPGNKGVDLENTSVHPAWKQHAFLPLWNANAQGNENAQQMQALINQVNQWDNRVKQVTPGGGSYLNEANIFDPDWQKEMYGSNWQRLARIKEEVDPLGVFYAETAVGSQNWRKVGQWDQLCPV